MNIAEMKERTRQNVERTGRSIMSVFPGEGSTDPTNEAYAYTIGNACIDLPELILVGTFGKFAAATLNELSEMMKERGRQFDNNEMVSLGGAFPVCAIEASDAIKKNMLATTHYLNHDRYRVMQVVFPDTEGRFPWEEGCAEPYSRVVVQRRLDA